MKIEVTFLTHVAFRSNPWELLCLQQPSKPFHISAAGKSVSPSFLHAEICSPALSSRPQGIHQHNFKGRSQSWIRVQPCPGKSIFSLAKSVSETKWRC